MSGSPSPDFFPAAGKEALRKRAAILATIRAFFRERAVLEVETPILCAAGAVDEHLEPIPVDLGPEWGRRYLVTSPEHSMKRLLAARSGPIFQITRAFRAGDRGRLHNPEFTILEWYRPGLDHVGLMGELEDLIRTVLVDRDVSAPDAIRASARLPFERIPYREAFVRAAGIDPHRASLRELAAAASERGAALPEDPGVDERDGVLNLILALIVEPTLSTRGFLFLTEYPPSQAALARVRAGDPPTAERFELYFRGVELANGYHELGDPGEQERRYAVANRKRRAAGKTELPVDLRFIEALRSGLPDCAGVAVGLDRLVLLACGAERIDDILAFPFERA